MRKLSATILVVDDNAVNRDMLSRRLLREGYTVATAGTGRAALEIMGVERFDLILLDLMMPELDGFGVLQRLARSPSTAGGAPIIVLTASSDRDSVTKCIHLGAVDYVVKPFEFVSLKSRIWRCLESARLSDRLGPEAMTAAGNPGTVLIVDDNAINRELLTARLAHFGCTPVGAENGEAALTRLREGDIDLVLLDIMMPGTDGYEVLKRIKGQDATRHLPVIMISALTDAEASVRCFELGADDFITKPFNAAELSARVRACLKLKRLQDQDAVRRARLRDLAEQGAQLAPR